MNPNTHSLVSIITPTYNCGRFIAETIKSLQAQTYQNWEMLIVDDCSTDDTRQIVKQFAGYSQIKYHCLEHNSGDAIARMTGRDADYETAAHHFKTAYAFAIKRQGYDTFQIDNHHARFLLLTAVKVGLGDYKNPYDIFSEAHRKLKTRRKGDDYRYYIYRVAAEYLPFWQKYHTLFSAKEIVDYKSACQEILDMAYRYMNLKDTAEQTRDIVRKTINALNQVINS